MAALASWSFQCVVEAGNFGALARQLAASPVGSVTVTAGGAGYTSDSEVTVSGGGGIGAVLAASILDGSLTAVTVVEGGAGYTKPPAIAIAGGGGSGATSVSTLAVQGGSLLRLHVPVPAAEMNPGGASKLARAALLEGYVPLPFDTRVGDATFAWYHGPMVPEPVEPLGVTLASAAAGAVYDRNLGLFDLTYADSLGPGTERDRANHAAVWPMLRDAVQARVQGLRARRIARARFGRTRVHTPVLHASALAAGAGGDASVGLLLRSALVSGWPGLEVKAYSGTIAGSSPLRPDPATLIPPLRMDRLAAGVLLRLYHTIRAGFDACANRMAGRSEWVAASARRSPENPFRTTSRWTSEAESLP